MPRELAVIRTDIWADTHWRTLTPGAQWLYEYLLTSPTLSQVGVADWRPNRVAKLARGLSREQVERYATELGKERFVLVDEETEEVAIRSFLRHDGVLLNPNLWKSVGIGFAEIASPTIRASVAEEMQRLREQHPEGMPTSRGGKVNPWASTYLRTALSATGSAPSPSPSDTPSETPSETPSGDVDLRGVRSTTTPAPTNRNASHSSARTTRKSREVQLPKNWAPTADHLERARQLNVDVASEAENFRLHAETHERLAKNWNAAFTMWLKKAKPSPTSIVPGGGDDIRDGFLFRQGKPVLGGPDGMNREQYDQWVDDQRAKAVRRG